MGVLRSTADWQIGVFHHGSVVVQHTTLFVSYVLLVGVKGLLHLVVVQVTLWYV